MFPEVLKLAQCNPELNGTACNALAFAGIRLLLDMQNRQGFGGLRVRV